MTRKEALEGIAKLVSGIKFSIAPGKFEDATLSDGSKIQYSVLEAGGDISVVDDKGTATPAPAGQYELSDGRIITVTEAGKIAEVKDAAPAAEGQAAAATPATPISAQAAAAQAPAAEQKHDAGDSIWQPQIDSIKQDLAWIVQRMAQLQAGISMLATSTQTAMSAQQEFMTSVLEADTAGAITSPKQTVFSEAKKDKEAAREKMQAGFKAFNERLKALKK